MRNQCAQVPVNGLKFKCDVSPDQMKALTFTYEIGKEIPEAKWEDLGLWR